MSGCEQISLIFPLLFYLLALFSEAHMLRYFCGLVLLLSSIALSADSGPKWVEVRSPHFTVLTNAGDKDGRRVASQFERMRTVFHMLMPTASDDAAAPITVLALKDKASFRTLEPAAYLAKGSLDLAGLFLRAPDKNYVLLRLDTEGEHPYSTVYHEYTHYMLRKTEAWMPVWLNEGLAEFYQNTDLGSKDVDLGEPSANDILYLRQQRLLPLATLLKVDHNSPYYHEDNKGSVFYAESWALVHYLEITDFETKTHRLQDYMRLLTQNVDPVVAAQQAFGDLVKLEQTLDRYISGGSFKQFRLLTPVVYAEESFEVRPVSTAQADAVRADVLLYVRGPKDAEALLESVLQADPKNAMAHETMGAVKVREGDIAAAKKWYGEAVKLDSQSFLAQYNFAVMSLRDRDKDQDAAIEQSLQTTIKLNPKFAPAYDALAQFYASRHVKLDEAHRLNSVAVGLEPESLPFRLNAATVLEQSDKFGDALNVLKAAKPVAKTLEETDMVERRIDSVERRQTAVEQEAKRRSERAAAEVAAAEVAKARPVEIEEPAFPATASGVRHTVSGVLHGVKCSGDSLLQVMLAPAAGKPIALYSNNYYSIVFTTANYRASSDLHPCADIEGMKARVLYGEVKDARVTGQIVSIQLSK
jgi:tetratricopeptide (TPR) repeat protein